MTARRPQIIAAGIQIALLQEQRQSSAIVAATISALYTSRFLLTHRHALEDDEWSILARRCWCWAALLCSQRMQSIAHHIISVKTAAMLDAIRMG